MPGGHVLGPTIGAHAHRPRLVLASASPRRRALLGALGLPFTVASADVDESIAPGEWPAAAAARLALAKALAVAATATVPCGRIIGADTIVVALDGDVADALRHPTILGKPRDAVEASAFLRRLRGRRHDVITGVAVLDAASGARAVACETTAVWMRPYADAEVAAYVASGDPMDKAGAYAVQHRGFHPVAALVGSESNVIGLPVGLVRRMVGWVR